MASSTLTKDTFVEAVQETIDVFGMSMEDAIKETAAQFQAQGVNPADLSPILAELTLKEPNDCERLNDALAMLAEYLRAEHADVDYCDYVKYVQIVREECDRGLAYRVAAGKRDAYRLLLATAAKFDDVDDETSSPAVVVPTECLKALASLMTQQSDLLDDAGIRMMIDYLDRKKAMDTRRSLLKWIKECCILHEGNRQAIFDAGILDRLKPMLGESKSALLRDVLAVLRGLALDDDVRVPFGRAHEHARAIASDTLCDMGKLLTRFKHDEPFMSDLMVTLNALLVRTEFCQKLADAGGLDAVKESMTNFRRNEKLMRQCFKLLKSLAGNDECKRKAIEMGCGPLIVDALNRHKDKSATAVAGLGCVAALTLRSPENSRSLYETGEDGGGIVETIVACMRAHADNRAVQKTACWAIRNMVSRSRYQCQRFLDHDVESLLKADLKKFDAECEYDVKAALRDLGCDVALKEEWTGKGGMLTTESKTTAQC